MSQLTPKGSNLGANSSKYDTLWIAKYSSTEEFVKGRKLAAMKQGTGYWIIRRSGKSDVVIG